MQQLEKTLSKVSAVRGSAHYKRRSDRQYDVVARVKIGDDWRFAALSVQPNRVRALEAVRFIRGAGAQ